MLDRDDIAGQTTATGAPRAAPGETLTECAYAALRADVISGALKPAARLRIDWLSKRYGIGPTPMREALQRLCADGMVVAEGHRGFAVAPLSLAEFEDLTIARVALEEQALRLSICNGDEAWEAQVAAAAYALRKRDTALIAEGAAALDGWERANAVFHGATVAACGSRWLLQMRDRLNVQAARYRLASIALRHAERDLAEEHAAIADAVLSRDAPRACLLVADHFRTTARLLAARA
jgi:DNA-binding GntR family transcriptional regulator